MLAQLCLLLEQCDRGACQLVGGGDPSDAAADDDHIHRVNRRTDG